MIKPHLWAYAAPQNIFCQRKLCKFVKMYKCGSVGGGLRIIKTETAKEISQEAKTVGIYSKFIVLKVKQRKKKEKKEKTQMKTKQFCRPTVSADRDDRWGGL